MGSEEGARPPASDAGRRLLSQHASQEAILDVLLAGRDAVYVKDRDGRYLMVNATGAASLGYTPEELAGKTDMDIFTGLLGERLWRSDQELMAAGETRTVHEPVLVAGQLRTFLSTKAPLRDASGAVIGLVGASTDATSLSASDETVRRREAHLAEAQALTRVGSWEYDVRTGEQSWSDEMDRILGREPQSSPLTFDAFLACVHPDDRDRLADESAGPRVDGSCSVDVRIIRPDGAERICTWRTHVYADLHGTPIRMIGAVQDLTEQRRAEISPDGTRVDSERAASVRQVRSVLDSAHEAFIAMDAGGFVIDWNPQAQRTFGWSSQEAIGQVLGDLIVPQRFRAAHFEGLRRYLQSGQATLLDRRLELSACDRAGREFPVEVTISLDETSSPPRFFAFAHDISERRSSERFLRAQNAITRVFAEAKNSGEAMHALLAGLGGAMQWQLGAWWSCEDGSDVLRCRSVWRSDPAIAPEFEAVTLELELARGVGLPGRVWETGLPAWTADLAADASFPRAGVAARAGLHASVCVPVLAVHEIRGAIEFFSNEVGETDQATREILGTIAEQIGGFVDVLDQRSELLEKLRRLALTDDLTGLPNRRAWHEALERGLAQARRRAEPLCVAMLDIDRFKRFNDAHGHQAGDTLLQELAQAWRAQLRVSDVLARYGGEEFALLFPAWPPEAAEVVLTRVRAATPNGQTCSAGLAAFDGTESAEHLVGRADAALYQAKEQGRDRTVVAGVERP